MAIKLIALAAGVVALVATYARRRAKRPAKLVTEPLSSDWLAQVRGRADDSL